LKLKKNLPGAVTPGYKSWNRRGNLA